MSTLAHRTLTNYHPAAPMLGGLAAMAVKLRHWHRIGRERQALARLSDYELKDFGATRGDVERELAKPFWRGPHL